MKITKFNIAVGLQHFAIGTLVASFYLYAIENNVTLTDLAWLGILTALVSFIFEPISSFLADKYNKKYVLLSGYLLLLFSFLSLILFSSVTAFITQMVLSTLALASLSGTEEAFLYDLTNELETSTESFTSSLSLMQIYDEVGTIFGSLGIGILGSIIGLRYGYISAVISTFVAAMIIISIDYARPNSQKEAHLEFDNPLENFTQFKKFISTKTTAIPVLVAMILYTFTQFRGQETWQVSMNFFGISTLLISFVFVAGKVSALLSSWLVYKKGKKISLKMAVLVGFLAQSLAYVLMLAGVFWSFLIGVCLYYFGENLIRPFLKNFILEISHKNLKTTYLSVISGIAKLNGIPLVFAVSLLADTNVIYGLAFMLTIKIIALVTATTLLLTKGEKYALA